MNTVDFSDLKVSLAIEEIMEDLRFGREPDDEENPVLERARALVRAAFPEPDLTFR